MASSAAVENRRLNRKADRLSRREKELKRIEHERAVALRMTVRFFPGVNHPPLMLLSYRYWQARRCGWDAMSKQHAVDAQKRPVDPAEGQMWLWWCQMHWRERAHIVSLSKFRLVRA
jgi:hypothetical protein